MRQHHSTGRESVQHCGVKGVLVKESLAFVLNVGFIAVLIVMRKLLRFFRCGAQPLPSSRRAARLPLRVCALWVEEMEPRIAPAHGPTDHIHATLTILIEGVPLTLPADIGVVGGTILSSPHTHAADNVLHIHPPPSRFVTVGEFFDVWRTIGADGVKNPDAYFSANRIMDKFADHTHVITMTVNGVANSEFNNYIPHDGDEILISYDAIPPPSTPSLQVQNITMLAGQTFHMPLDGFDPFGAPLTYTVSVSNPELVAQLTPSSNRSLLLNVSGDGFAGALTLQLFEDLAPATTARIIELVQSGFYSGLTFHRVINNFMAQGGDPNGDGTGGTGVKFDDEFSVMATFTGFGQLAMANSGDDTNDSQFFITDLDLSHGGQSAKPPTHLNFNHTIFGQLTGGFEIFHALINTPVTGSTPNTTVTITSAAIVTDTENAVLRIFAPANLTGDLVVTVTGTSTSGVVTKSFVVTVVADTTNDRPFLGPVSNQATLKNTPISFTVSATDLENDALTLVVRDPAAAAATFGSSSSLTNATVSINQATRTITITPNTGFVGTIAMLIGVRDGTARDALSLDHKNQFDTQRITLTVADTLFEFSGATYSVNESGGAAIITITRSGDTSAAATVDFATSDATAVSPADYTMTLLTVDFDIGETSKTVSIPMINDALPEGNETVKLTLSNPSLGALGNRSTATLTVGDDDGIPPQGQLEFSLSNYDILESQLVVTVTVRRLGGSTGPVTVDFASSDGTAKAGLDYVPVSGTLSFAAGETIKSFKVFILDDDGNEGNETIQLGLSNPTGGAILGAQTTATVTIQENDVGPANNNFRKATEITGMRATTFGTNVGATKEPGELAHGGNAGGVSVWWKWTAPLDGQMTIQTANSNFDTLLAVYTGGSLTTLTRVANNDDAVPNQTLTSIVTFNVTAGTTYHIAVDGYKGATGNITLALNLIPVEGEFRFSAATYRVGEGVGEAQLIIERHGGSRGAVTVEINPTGGSATADVDYLAPLAMVTFAEGETKKVVSIPILDDPSQEGDETITWTLSNPGGGAILAQTQIVTTLAIADNDTARKAVFTDSDGDTITIELKNAGILLVAPGDFAITLTGTTGSSALSIAVQQTGGGNGVVDIPSITATGSLKSIKATAANLTGSGMDIGGHLAALALRDVLNGADILTGGSPTQSTKIQLRNVEPGSIINIGSLLGRFHATLLDGATIHSYSGINSFSALRVLNSLISSGFTPSDPADPMLGGNFAAGDFINKISIKGLKNSPDPAFVNSVIAAEKIGKVSLGAVATDNGGVDFGVLARSSISGVMTAAPSLSLKQLVAPHDQAVTDFHVKITGNNAPQAVSDGYVGNEDTMLTIAAAGVLANDTDFDGDPLMAILVGGPSNGILVFNADGSFEYTPNANFFGTDSFTYRVSDGSLLSNLVTVILNISPVNDGPPVANDDVAVTDEDVAVTVDVLANDANLMDTPIVVSVQTPPSNGTVVVNADRSITYTPQANFYGVDSFQYRVTDRDGEFSVATVNVTIHSVNDPPVAHDDGPIVTTVDTSVNVDVLANDTDGEGDPLTIIILTSTHGVAVVNDNGTPLDPTDDTVDFMPDPAYTGPAEFTYKVNDGSADSNVATVFIMVNP